MGTKTTKLDQLSHFKAMPVPKYHQGWRHGSHKSCLLISAHSGEAKHFYNWRYPRQCLERNFYLHRKLREHAKSTLNLHEVFAPTSNRYLVHVTQKYHLKQIAPTCSNLQQLFRYSALSNVLLYESCKSDSYWQQRCLDVNAAMQRPGERVGDSHGVRRRSLSAWRRYTIDLDH